MVSLNLYAGPEDHIADQVCYFPEAPQFAAVNSQISSEICLENISVNPTDETISVYSYFNQGLFSHLKVTSFMRRNEDYYVFKAVGTLFSKWNSGCGDGEQINLDISGQVFVTGEGNINDLDISARAHVYS